MDLLQLGPLAFEVGKNRLFGVGRGAVLSVEPVQKVVVDLSAGIDSPRQPVVEFVGRMSRYL